MTLHHAKSKRAVSFDEFLQGIRDASMRIRGIDVCPDCRQISDDCECV